MDGGSGLNILYVNTLDTMHIPRSELHLAGSPLAIPNYTYLKLKMPGPNDIITMSSAFSHAFTCDLEHFELATAVINSSKLPRLGESSTPAVLDYNKPTPSMAFSPLEETKVMGINPIR